jgi:glycosyltransferase involved in cell wall biosynthesis
MKNQTKKILLWIPLPEGANWRGEGIAQTIESLLRASVGSQFKFKIVTSKSTAEAISHSLNENWRENIVFSNINDDVNYEVIAIDKQYEVSTIEMGLLALGKWINRFKFIKIFSSSGGIFYYIRLRILTLMMSKNFTHKDCDLVWAPMPSTPFLENIERNLVINFWDGFVFEYREFKDISPYFLLKFRQIFSKKNVHIVTQSKTNAEFLESVFKVPSNKISIFRLGCPDYLLHLNSLKILDKIKVFKNDRSLSILDFYPNPQTIRIPSNNKNKKELIQRRYIENSHILSTLYRLNKSCDINTKIILISTQYRPYKGLALVLKIISELQLRSPSIKYLVITTCNIPSEIKDKYPELFNSLFELTRIPDKGHATLTALSDLVLHPSFVEGGLGSYSMFEAASVGVPSLTNSGRHTNELNNLVLEDLDTAFENFTNINSTVEKIIQILTDGKLALSIVETINQSRQDWAQTWLELESVFEHKIKITNDK